MKKEREKNIKNEGSNVIISKLMATAGVTSVEDLVAIIGEVKPNSDVADVKSTINYGNVNSDLNLEYMDDIDSFETNINANDQPRKQPKRRACIYIHTNHSRELVGYLSKLCGKTKKIAIMFDVKPGENISQADFKNIVCSKLENIIEDYKIQKKDLSFTDLTSCSHHISLMNYMDNTGKILLIFDA